MTSEGILSLIVFVMASSGVLLIYTLVAVKRTHLDARLEDLGERDDRTGYPAARSGQANAFTETTIPRLGTALMPADEEERTVLRTRLIHAGLYGRETLSIFLGAKLLLIVTPTLAGLALGGLGLVPTEYALLGAGCCGIVGMIGPGFWLDHRKAKRQTSLRRALPDALDLLVICLEGGLSLSASLRRVGAELRTAHPLLARELTIVEREVQLGSSPGQSLQKMGVRTDLEEIRSMASVITQAERFGASLVKSLRIHAETLRTKRQQHAEEMAAKAAVKVLFPTLLCIFPSIFVVILGPAVFQILEQLGTIMHQ
ncbi:MAG: type II secretion system F family protein [Isosphaeraceae bacterium]